MVWGATAHRQPKPRLRLSEGFQPKHKISGSRALAQSEIMLRACVCFARDAPVASWANFRRSWVRLVDAVLGPAVADAVNPGFADENLC